MTSRFAVISMFAFLILPVIGCSTSQQNSPNTPTLNITVVEPDRIRFSGKGAGAGMMLMSSMGPMGIAIGVAIDEGIGKDIDENARTEPFDIREVFREEFIDVWSQDRGRKNLYSEVFDITIERYGFITRAGEGDPVAPQLHMKIGEKVVKFPEDFSDQKVPLGQLDLVKTDPRLVNSLYRSAAAMVSKHVLLASSDN